MREIKFRAWDTVNSRMGHFYEGFQWCDEYNLWFINQIPEDRERISDVPCADNIIMMQFTGIHDKNGKEVYEGDIMQYKSYHVFKRWWATLEDIPVIEEEVKKQMEDIAIIRAKVRWETGSFDLDYPVTLGDVHRGEMTKYNKNNGNGDSKSKYWDFEVIGNVHENPELLTQQP